MQGTQTPVKICPQCQTTHPLTAPYCACGHVFRTQFVAPNQTQAFAPGSLGAPAPVAQPIQPLKGPRDAFEWKVAAWAQWMLVFMLSVLVYYCLRWSGFTPVWLGITFAAVAGLLFSVVRLRRLYVYNTHGLTAPVPAFVFFLVLALCIGGWEFREARMIREDRIALDVARDKIQPFMESYQVAEIMGSPVSVDYPQLQLEVWHYPNCDITIFAGRVNRVENR